MIPVPRAGFSVLLCLLLGPFGAPGPARGADVLRPLDIRQVKVGGEIGRRIDVTVNNNAMALDADGEFLEPFRTRNRKSGYIGLGKLIDGLVRFAAYTRDPGVRARKEHVVRETIRTQEPDGYIGTLEPSSRVWKLWDVHEMSYLVLGLTADYQYFGNRDALEAARKLADYIVRRWSAEPRRKPGEGSITVHMAITGIGSAFLALHESTRDRRYLDFCTRFLDLPHWDYPIVLGRWGPIGGHAYTYLCRCLAQLRLCRIQPEAGLLGPSRKVLDFLLRRDGLVISGACGDHECWHDTQTGTTNLGETCATAYLVRWLDNLLRLGGDGRTGDIMERAIFNALFGAQSPDGRRVRYYTPFDGPRKYHPGDTYCCPSNYRRIIAELPGMIYYRSARGVAVNLYTPSEAKVDLPGGVELRIRQETAYPASGTVAIRLDPSRPASFGVSLRIPGWCRGATVQVGGGPKRPAGAGLLSRGFVTIERPWKAGDAIRLEMPMPWRLVKGRKAQAGCVAVMRGPLLFTLNRARHEKLAGIDLRLLTIDPSSLKGPIADDTVHPDGIACTVRAWGPGAWYPAGKPNLEFTLTEFPDPGGEAAYFHVPDPEAAAFARDELAREAPVPSSMAAALPPTRLEPEDPPSPTDLPTFWKSRLKDIDEEVSRLRKGKAEIVAVSPGGRPVVAVAYGEKDDLHMQANYNSAVAARDPGRYARKGPGVKPVVFFLGPVHGQEVEGIVGLLNLIHIAETGKDHRGKSYKELQQRIEKCRVIIVPCANPDGRARCPYDAFVGIPTRTMTKYGQGTHRDGSLWGWPGAKALHPMKGDVGILGAYFNDYGINPMHDDFFSPMAAETAAILRIARREAPDMTVSLHSHENRPIVLQARFVPWFVKTRIQDFSRRLGARLRSEGLPYGEVRKPAVEDEKPPARSSFNLVSALHNVSGTTGFTFECSHGSVSKEGTRPLVTHEQILDIQLCLYDEMLKTAGSGR